LLSVPPIQIDCAAAGTDAVEASAKAAADIQAGGVRDR